MYAFMHRMWIKFTWINEFHKKQTLIDWVERQRDIYTMCVVKWLQNRSIFTILFVQDAKTKCLHNCKYKSQTPHTALFVCIHSFTQICATLCSFFFFVHSMWRVCMYVPCTCRYNRCSLLYAKWFCHRCLLCWHALVADQVTIELALVDQSWPPHVMVNHLLHCATTYLLFDHEAFSPWAKEENQMKRMKHQQQIDLMSLI